MTKAQMAAKTPAAKAPAATPPVQSAIKRRTRSKRYMNRAQQFKIKNAQVKEQTEAMLAAGRNKIKVSGLPRFYVINDPLLQSFLKTVRDDLKLNVVHTRFSKKGNAWLYLSFATEEEQVAALEKLKRFTWQGRTLISTLVTTDELKKEDDDEASASKKIKIEIPLEEQVLMSQIPFYSIDYEEQLSKKHEEAHSLLARVRDLMVRQGHAKEWCDKRCKELESDIPFALEKIRPCPMINEYRNKFDFVIGYKPHLETYGVGVRVKDAEDGTLQVGPIDELRNLPKPMIQLAKIFDGYINKDNHQHWLCFTVRKNSLDEYMVIAGATNIPKTTKTRGKPVAKQEPAEPAKPFDPVLLEQMKQDVTGLFKNVNFCKLKSIYLETERGRSKSDHDLHHLWGETQIKEKLGDLEIAISPSTFFRQNSSGTEVLCSVVEELADLTSETTLLDLFCGSGSLSLTLAKKCKHVIGVEVLESNLEDAKKNAELNGIKNCEFIAGKIEDEIEKILSNLQDKEVVVVLDPPRSGIHARIVHALRNFAFCKRFVYVCSNHKLPFRNLLDLSSVITEPKPKNKAFDTDPFLPVKVVPVDMTPHSLRSELVIQCDRQPKDQFKSIEEPKSTPATETTKVAAKKPNQQQQKKKVASPEKKFIPNRNSLRGVGGIRGVRGMRGMRGMVGMPRGSMAMRGGPPFNSAPYPVPPRAPNPGPPRANFERPAMNSAMYLDSIRDIERRAYEEGLVKGLERSAYQMGLAQGMNKPADKYMDWESPAERRQLELSRGDSWSSPPNPRGWDREAGGSKWNSSSASSDRFRDPAPSPWSSDYAQNSSGFGSSSSGFYPERAAARSWGSSTPSDFGFSRNASSSAMKVWDTAPSTKNSFGDSFGGSPWSKTSSFSSSPFNGEARRSAGFNSSMNSSFGAARNTRGGSNVRGNKPRGGTGGNFRGNKRGRGKF
ncbi:unnamed protein product [Bemisia tabaci]|uniref:tRNA (uracil(54)-C(5))-methyltransferase n=1 Tax=Bemisia tabaci TaxID=7038 RepID=A0A9P0AEL7_BEMTA|nr:unnamed protein product [Bemisia tabaci]